MSKRALITDFNKALGEKVDSYRGKWVAIRYDEVIAYEETLSALLKIIGDKHVVVAHIPEDDTYDE